MTWELCLLSVRDHDLNNITACFCKFDKILNCCLIFCFENIVFSSWSIDKSGPRFLNRTLKHSTLIFRLLYQTCIIWNIFPLFLIRLMIHVILMFREVVFGLLIKRNSEGAGVIYWLNWNMLRWTTKRFFLVTPKEIAFLSL